MTNFEEYSVIQRQPGFRSLYHFVVDFLKQMREKRESLERKRQEELARNPPQAKSEEPVVPFADRPNSGYTPGRMLSYANPYK